MMKYKILIAILFFLMTCSAFAQVYPNVKSDCKINPDKDNQIFIPGKEFIYDYKIINASGQEFKAIKDSVGLVNPGAANNQVEEIHLAVIQPKLFKRTNKRQTEVVYSHWPNPVSFSGTGVVENEKNVWIHSPRSDFFRILETCPFPYVKYPIETGHVWNDKVNIHDWWSSPLWMEWEGRLLFNIEYKITGSEKVGTEIGNYKCWVIEGKATSEKGETKLISYFNEDVGFVKLIYITINNLTIEFNLIQVIENKSKKGLENYMIEKLSGIK